MCGYRIPKNTMIIPLQWALHMNPKIWQDPNTFDPDRFVNASGQFFAPSEFLPFQTGKRMCLGDELAKMLLFLYCSQILYNFNVCCDDTTVSEKYYGECGITLVPCEYSIKFKIKNI